MNILVAGLVNVETTVAVRGFPIPYYPIDYPFFGVRSNVSGVGFNIVRALSALGDRPTLYSFLGHDAEAERVLRQLWADGIDASNVRQTLKETPSSVVLFDPAGKRQIYCDLKDIQEQRLDWNAARDDLLSCDAAALCNIEFNRPLIRAAKEHGVLTATDVHVLGDVEDAYNRDFMANADILFLSDENLSCEPETFIRRLADRYHNAIIVIGMGAQGAMLYVRDTGAVCMVPAYTAGPVVNTVGAGDALFSAFLHFYLRDRDALAALRRAVVFAGLKIGYNGASVGFCTEAETEAAYRAALD